jgi:hypothetical protein
MTNDERDIANIYVLLVLSVFLAVWLGAPLYVALPCGLLFFVIWLFYKRWRNNNGRDDHTE